MHETRFRIHLALLGFSLVSNGWAQSTAQPTEVIVQSSPLDRRSTRDATAASTVLRRGDLIQPGASTAAVLTRSPGIQVRRSGAASELATVTLRGGLSNQLPIYLGPFQLNDELAGSVDLSMVPLFFIDRIEVYRGHAPVFVDRPGLGGAIVLEPMLPKGTRLHAGVSLGSYGSTTSALRASTAGRQVGNVVGIQRTTSANDYPYEDNRGTVTDPRDDRQVRRSNADAESVDFWNSGYYRPSSFARVRWLVHGFQRDQGVTGLSIIPARHVRARTKRQLGALTATLPCRRRGSLDDCHIEIQSQWQQSKLTIEDPTSELGLGTDRIDSATMRNSERIRLVHRPLSRLELGWLLGSDLGTFAQINRSADGLNASRRSALLGLHAQVDLTSSLAFVALGRATSDTTIAVQEPTRNAVLPSGRLGMHYRIVDGLDLRANVGRYVRVPTLAELYGISASLRGNSELSPESGFSDDLGLIWRFGNARLGGITETVLYHQQVRDLVAWQRSSFGQVRPYNVGRARMVGVEQILALAWSRAFRVEAVVGLIDPRDVTPNRIYNNDILPYRSRLTTSLRFDAGLPSPRMLPAIRQAGIGASIYHRSSRYSAPAGNAILPSTTALDLDLRVALIHAPMTLHGSITDVLNRQNYDLLGMPLPGRCYFLRVDLDWEVEP